MAHGSARREGEHLPTLREGVVPVRRVDILIPASEGIDPGLTRNMQATPDSPGRTSDEIVARGARDGDEALVIMVYVQGGDV